MYFCSKTLRACSHSRVSTSKTLLPFLYQTATILQPTPIATRPPTRRAFRSRSHNSEDIPFADDEVSSAVDQEPIRATTITGNERQAFQKLYQSATRQDQAKNDGSNALKPDEIGDNSYEEDDKSLSLGRVFDEVLAGKHALQARAGTQRTSRRRASRKPGHAAEDDLADQEEQATHALSIAASRATALKLKQLRTSEMHRFTKLLLTARTDIDLWHMLESEVFARVRSLNLDGPPPKNRSEARIEARERAATIVEQRVLFQNFPHYLVKAIQILRERFPASPLPLSILPALKSLGRSSYALGATTSLYYHLIHTAWVQFSSYSNIELLLDDMENSAIEFDAEILSLLENIIKEHDMAVSGVFGREMLMVYGTDLFREGIAKIGAWRDVVEKRVGPLNKKPKAIPKQRLDARASMRAIRDVSVVDADSSTKSPSIDSINQDNRVNQDNRDNQDKLSNTGDSFPPKHG